MCFKIHFSDFFQCIGDQQAATLGQLCLEPGTSKGTYVYLKTFKSLIFSRYGTGYFMLLNTGNNIKFSKNGLLTTALFKLGDDQPAYYALEGSVAACGSMVRWLRDNLGFIQDSSQVSKKFRVLISFKYSRPIGWFCS